MMLILSLGFLACLILKEILCILCFTLFFLVYLYYRFKDKRIRILFILFSLLSCILVYPKEVQQQDTYKITEIKKGYYIGKNRGSKILIQTDLDLSFQDEVKVKHIEPIHTDDNFTLFSFTRYNENKNIRYKTNSVEIIHKSTSFKSRLYNYLKLKPNSSIVLSLYYGIHDESIDEIYTMLGYGYMSAYYIVLHVLRRKWDETKIRRILLVFSVLFGHFFVFTLAFTRFILYQLSTLLFTSKPNQMAPGIGKDLGANFNLNNSFFKGIFMAPNAVKSALKTAVFTAYMLEKLGYKNVSPAYNDERTDIIQTLELGSKENLVSFTQGIQSTSPIDSFVRVMAAPMPGYPFDEVMAAGSFTQGSTIELSADAPVVEPYTLYMQGGLTLEYGKLSILLALTNMKNN